MTDGKAVAPPARPCRSVNLDSGTWAEYIAPEGAIPGGSMDIATDVDVLERMLEKDGLGSGMTLGG